MADFDPAEFNILAADLLSNLSGAPAFGSAPNQAKVRTAIGRAYYAAFLIARQGLLRPGTPSPNRGVQDHRLVVEALGGQQSELGGKMYRLRLKRNAADYNLNPSGFTLQAGQYWLGIASDIITEFGKRP